MEQPTSDPDHDETPVEDLNHSPDPPDSHGRRKRLPSIIAWSVTGLLVIIIGAVMVYAGLRQVEEPAPPKKKLANVEVETVRTEGYREALTLPALIEADRVASIRPEFSGKLSRWFFEEGADVKEGEPVAELNMDLLMASLEELKASMTSASQNANLAAIAIESARVQQEHTRKRVKVQELALKSAQSSHKLALTEFRRIEKLVRQKTISSSRLDTSRNALTQAELSVSRAGEAFDSAKLDERSAKLRVKEAKASLKVANARLMELDAAIANILVRVKKSTLRAPITGRLEEHLVEPGEMVTAGLPISKVYDLGFLRATVNVPDRYISFLDPKNEAAKAFIRMYRPGAEQRVSAEIIIPGLPKLAGGNEPGITFRAEIARIAQSSDPESNTFKVELRFPNPGRALRHGVIARGKVSYLYYPRAILIPAKAIQVTDVGPRVLVVEASKGRQIVAVRDIEPNSIRGSKILIGKGLGEGDRLVVTGWKGLVGGEEVNVLVEDGRFTSRSASGELKKESSEK